MIPERPSDSYLNDPGFQSVLVACLEKLERGESLDRDRLMATHPHYAEALGAFLDDHALLQRVASEVRDSWLAPGSPGSRAAPFEETVDSNPKVVASLTGERIRYIGEYEVLAEIARGGMGVVFKARQRNLNRVVALKMILAGRLADSGDIERFRREARAAGALKHPNIVSVHEIGEHEGRHYFTMDFVEGRSLAEEIREESLAPRAAAQLVRRVAEAVQYAHGRGTVHRDLKPANVLLTPDRTPHVTDFGLAKLLESVDEDSRAELTASGQILGTPSYMSPEQASGKHQLVGPASDIYSLGAILYACLTGRAPFVADSPVDTLLQVMRKEPVSPRALNPSVPRDLETICLKCLAKEPHRRYGTAGLLAEDLKRFVGGFPVRARPVGTTTKLLRWTRRNPGVAALLALVVLLLVGGTAVSLLFAVAARRAAAEAQVQRDEARHQESIADRQREIATRRLAARTRTLYALQLTRAHDLWKEVPDEAAALLGNKDICPPRLRDFAWRYLSNLCDRRIERWNDKGGPIRALDFSADESLIAAGGVGKTVPVYRRGGQEPIAELKDHPGWIQSVRFSPDGGFLATASKSTVTLWDTTNWLVSRRIDHGGEVRAVTFLPGGNRLLSAGDGIAVWDTSTGQLVRRLADPSTEVYELAQSQQAPTFVTAGEDGAILLWRTDGSEPPRKLAEAQGRPSCLDLNGDGSRILFADEAALRIHDMESGEEVLRVRRPLDSLRSRWVSGCFSPDGRWIAAYVSTWPIKIWDAENGRELLALTPDLGTVSEIRFAPGGDALYTGDQSGTVTLWRVPPTTGHRLLDVNGFRVVTSPKGDRFAVTDQQGVDVVDVESGATVLSIPVAAVFRLRFSPSGDRLAGLVEGGDIRIWDATSGREIARRNNRTGGEALAFVDDGRRLAFSSGKGAVTIWDPESDETHRLDGGGRDVLCLALSPDGRRLVAGHGIHPLPDGTPPGKVVVWELSSRKVVSELRGHSGFGVYDVAFSPDGKTLLSAGGGVILWDAATLEQRAELSGHTSAVFSAAFAPDGRTIATASMDNTVRLWDPISGEQRISLTGHPTWATSVAFAADGKYLISAGFDNSVRVWAGIDEKGR